MYKLLFLLIALTGANSVIAQKGKVLESLVFNSSKVNYPVEY